MDWIDDVIRDVSEFPDRDSPADWPDAMLVTAAELRLVIERHCPMPKITSPDTGLAGSGRRTTGPGARRW